MAKATDTKSASTAKTATKRTRSAAETEKIRAALVERRDELQAEYDQTLTEITELQRDRLTDSAGDDQADTGTKTFEREQEISLANNLLERITQVERAIDRLGEGNYGWCEKCGNAIPVERLAAFPSATLCVSLQAAGGTTLNADEATVTAAGPGTPTGFRGRALAMLVVTAVVAVVLDQVVKELSTNNLVEGEPVRILGGLIYLSLLRNSGAAFSLGSDYTWVFPLVTLAVIGLDRVHGPRAAVAALGAGPGAGARRRAGQPGRPAVPGARRRSTATWST